MGANKMPSALGGKVVQMESLSSKYGRSLVALCDDGTLWSAQTTSATGGGRWDDWQELPKIPQREVEIPDMRWITDTKPSAPS